MLKKIKGILFLSMLLAVCLIPAPTMADGISVDDISFMKNGSKIFVSSPGTVSADVTITASQQSEILLIQRVYSVDSAITDVSFQTETVSAGTSVYSCNAVTVSEGEKVDVYVWSDTLVPLNDVETLDDLSRDAGITNFSVNTPLVTGGWAQKKIVAVNPVSETIEIFSSGSFTDETKSAVSVSYNTESNSYDNVVLDMTSGSAVLSVWAPHGNLQNYTVRYTQCNKIWDEEWTGAGIAGSNCYVDDDTTKRQSSKPYCPTYGTWASGTYIWNYGGWNDYREAGGDRKSNNVGDKVYLSIPTNENSLDDSTAANNTVLKAVCTGWDANPSMQFSYFMNGSRYSGNATMVADSHNFKVGGDQPGHYKYMGGWGFALLKNENGQYFYSLMNSDTTVTTPVFEKDEWHNMSIVINRTSTSDAEPVCDIYFDGVYCGSATYIKPIDAAYLGVPFNNYTGFGFTSLKDTENASLYFDNMIVLGK